MADVEHFGWQLGPDNCAAYLKHYGTFGAKAMFLLVSSHDAHDNIDFLPVVGVYEAYPKEKYWSAWAELICRYVWPRTIGKLFTNIHADDPDAAVVKSIDGSGIKKGGKVFNPGFAELKHIADSVGIPLIICLHPDKKEVETKEYNEQGVEIIRWCENNSVILVKELDEGITLDMYRDGIHTNEKGLRFEGELMNKYIKI